jgi:hypothetical protein
MIKEHKVNQLDNFIGGWYMENPSVCDRIIEFHKNSPDTVPGLAIGLDGTRGVHKEAKDSMDLVLDGNQELYNAYFTEFNKIHGLYKLKYPASDRVDFYKNTTATNIQHYAPGGGYYEWHTERQMYGSNRHLVFMTYLNDVDDGGETQFLHQKIKITPRKGLTLIWPTDWTFYHRGIPSPTQHKYIVTGWLSFYTEPGAPIIIGH